VAVGIEQVLDVELFPGNKGGQGVAFGTVIAARVNDDALPGVVVEHVGIFGEGVEGEYFDMYHAAADFMSS
jgi:hypothetical protein